MKAFAAFFEVAVIVICVWLILYPLFKIFTLGE